VGPPAAGKTTWVLERATSRDIIIDFDRLVSALTNGWDRGKDDDPGVVAVVKEARAAAIRVASRLAGGRDVYVVHAVPSAHTVLQYRRAGAMVVTVDPGREVVLARCVAERSPGAVEKAHQWYESGYGSRS
jgi:hypothetical protein